MESKPQTLKTTKGQKKVVSFWTGIALHRRLIQEANRMGVSKSDAIRILLERGLANDTE